MTVNQANNEAEGDDSRWGRARTDSAFQSTGSVEGLSAASPFLNPDNESAYSPVSGAVGSSSSTLTPRFGGRFGILRPVPATQAVHNNWHLVVALPDADLSTYSLQAHRDTQIAHGNVGLNTYWDQRQEIALPQYGRPSIAGVQAQGIGVQLATGTYGQAQYAPYPMTRFASSAEGTSVVDHTLSDFITRPRLVSRLPPINVDVANGRVASPYTPHSSVSTEPDTALFSPGTGGGDVIFTHPNPFTNGVNSSLRSPDAASPRSQVIFTPQSVIGPQPPFQTPQTSNRARRPSRASQEKHFNKEEKDLVLYLGLQRIHCDAIGVELGRITRQCGNNMGIDLKSKLIGRRVAACLRGISVSKGSEEEADQIVTDLMARAEREGWSEGMLSRAKQYSYSLERGVSITVDQKTRKFEARCRSTHKKWRINHPDSPPRENAKHKDEKLAFQGMLLEGTAGEGDEPSHDEMKKNLLELWETCTIAGKAVK